MGQPVSSVSHGTNLIQRITTRQSYVVQLGRQATVGQEHGEQKGKIPTGGWQ